jgi:hypothetical protein
MGKSIGTERCNRTFVCRVLIRSDDEHSLRYGASEVSELDARGLIERYFRDQKVEDFTIVEMRPATASEAASLNLSTGRVALLN